MTEPIAGMPGAVPPSGQGTAHHSAAWGPGRVAAVVIASIAMLVAIAAIVAGAAAIAIDQTQRDSSGYLMADSTSYTTGTYALVSDSYRAGTAGDWFVARELLGRVRIRTRSASPTFVGIAPASAARSYLANVARAEATGFDAHNADFHARPGGAPSTPPTAQHFWAASASGAGVRTLTWKVRDGNWRVVVMNANGTRSVATELRIGARLPHLLTIGIAVLGGGLLLLLLSGGGAYLAIRPTRSARLGTSRPPSARS